jgi:hypothetical protein
MGAFPPPGDTHGGGGLSHHRVTHTGGAFPPPGDTHGGGLSHHQVTRTGWVGSGAFPLQGDKKEGGGGLSHQQVTHTHTEGLKGGLWR